LGAQLSFESKSDAVAGPPTPNSFAVDGEFLFNFQNLRHDLGKVDGNQMHRSDLNDLEQRICCGVIQLQHRLLNTTAGIYQKQMDGLVENLTASQLSHQYFGLVSFLTESLSPIDRIQSARDTVAHVGSALRHLREYFSFALSAAEPLESVETSSEAMM
jgi:hypothetical protein